MKTLLPLFFMAFFNAVDAKAMNFVPWNNLGDIRVTMHRKTYSPSNFDLPPEKVRRSCRHIFRQLTYMMNNQNLSNMGPSSIQNRELPENYQAPEINSLVNRTLDYWLSTGHYSKANIEYLKKLDESLPPMRTHYVEIVHKQAVASIRIFDGSSDVWSGPLPWYEIRGHNEILTPIERNYNVIFGERSPEQHSYVLEIGLLGNPKIFQHGVDAVFSRVADWVDSTYNQLNFRTFGDFSVIRQRNLQIYGIARPELVKYYKKLGLQPVMKMTEWGTKPYSFDDGMVLLKMSGEDMIRLHFDKPMFPEIDGSKSEFASTLPSKKQWRLNRELDRQPAWDIRSMDEFWTAWDNIVARYWGEMQKTPDGSPQEARAYEALITHLYQLYKAPIYHQSVHPAVAAMKFSTLKQLLTTPVEQGWHLVGSMVINLEYARRFPESLDWQKISE